MSLLLGSVLVFRYLYKKKYIQINISIIVYWCLSLKEIEEFPIEINIIRVNVSLNDQYFKLDTVIFSFSDNYVC